MRATRPITDWNEVPLIMDLPFASRLLGRSPESLKQLSQKKQFPAFKVGKEWRVEKDALLGYIRSGRVMEV